jgi:hypothetical protein
VESLPSKKKDPQRGQGLKRKRGEVSYEELHVTREREDEIYMLLGEILSKERKEITFSYSAKSDVWTHPYPYIICICTTFYSLIFPFLPPFTIPFSINHDYLTHKLFRIFLCLYNIQGIA